VNFTREPIIETIISPKEGCKLLIRSSKSGSGAEEHYVDAVEVVSFGRAFFFRSMERPKAFLVPVSDYEVLEVKEMRVALKNVSHERNIKIGGGREASIRHGHRELAQDREREPVTASAEEEQQPVVQENGLEAAIGARMEKRRDRRRRRHRRSSEDQEDWTERRQQQSEGQESQLDAEQKAQGGVVEDETKVSSPIFSSLIPPPSTLISETLGRYKDKEFMEGVPFKEVEAKEKKTDKKSSADEEPTGSESEPLNRVSSSVISENLEITSFSSTHFSPLQGGNDSYFF
jgi:hypothetical protein